ncbi:MAG: B12-binding domain-containing radical SAM protein [Candidatus Omnitrophica bacterium]|nr:B12-binding domain-containing radical SAM protein [Candidatus Omnitrophota bacterium]
MILFIEPISKNTGMYVPAYPLSIMEIASFVKSNSPKTEIEVISMPVDYGLPLTQAGKEKIYKEFFRDLAQMKPKGVGISCTAISQAEEVVNLCERIKDQDPNIFIFLGGYFPTIYYGEIFSRTSAVDLIVIGEGEISSLKIIERLDKGKNPLYEDIPNLAWKKNGHIYLTRKGDRFDLKKKALLNLRLLKYPRAYDILPYAFSRGCPYRCNFCMEGFIRSTRMEVPSDIVRNDLTNLSSQGGSNTLLVSDALFKSFDLFSLLRSLNMRVNFETRCDILAPLMIQQVAAICGMIALGFESASYRTLRRMNKIRDREHYQHYISNTMAIFKEAVKNEIPLMVFMIAGYPGDTEEDLEESLGFAQELSKHSGPGGHVFKIGECHVYPETKIHDLALSLPNVVFDDDGVFGQNIVTQPSKYLDFETVLRYAKEIFDLSNYTPKLQETLLNIMPFFRLPVQALRDDMIPNTCFKGNGREVFNVQGDSLLTFKKSVPMLIKKYRKWMSGQRATRNLPF